MFQSPGVKTKYPIQKVIQQAKINSQPNFVFYSFQAKLVFKGGLI